MLSRWLERTDILRKWIGNSINSDDVINNYQMNNREINNNVLESHDMYSGGDDSDDVQDSKKI